MGSRPQVDVQAGARDRIGTSVTEGNLVTEIIPQGNAWIEIIRAHGDRSRKVLGNPDQIDLDRLPQWRQGATGGTKLARNALAHPEISGIATIAE